ncbi:type II secretion system F family protein [Acidiferrobacter sp.]|jgi:tight adherence protein B|uniref:type II secretion system F family protein n=1 Tax=Acidiferrobacter sp. TaxID=1872107 RepID=UPI002623C135|nr:type II secretion system F family protein [Acidiferrobacter sp.]
MITALILAFLAAALAFYVLLESVLRGVKWQQARVEDAARHSLTDLFIFIEPRQLVVVNALLFILLPGGLWLFTGNPILAFVGAGVAVAFPRFLVRILRERRLRAFVRQMPDALRMLASSLRAGAGLNVALEVITKDQPPPLAQEFALLLREQRMGVSFEEALAHLEKRLPVEEFRLFTAGLRIARSVGGNLSEILESLAHTLTRKAEVEGKIRSLTAQGKIQGLVMTLLPVLLMFVLRAMEPKPMALLFHSLIGWVVLAIVAIMEVLGYVFIRKIVTIEI